MNALSDRGFNRINWQAVIMFSLGFWLSCSLLLDGVIIPGLASAGMMMQDSFASAGYLIFGIFNRIELLCAALVLIGFLVFWKNHHLGKTKEQWSVILSTLLFSIALIYTYILTPQMSALGMHLSLLDSSTNLSTAMIQMHEGYWFLEIIKLVAGATLLRWCYRQSCTLA